jgi:hypothetical protein
MWCRRLVCVRGSVEICEEGKTNASSIRVRRGDTFVQVPAAEYFTAFKRHGGWVAGGKFEGEATITVY